MACFFVAAGLGNKSASNYFRALAAELTARGHTVVVIAPRHGGAAENQNSNPKVFNWISKRPTHWRDAQFLRGLIKQFRPDCIVATFASVNVCALVGWANRVPHRVVWYRTLSAQIDADNQNPRWKNNLFRLRKRIVYLFATKFIANSEASSLDLQNVYKIEESKCSVLHLLVAEPEIGFPPEKSHKVVCVGRLHPSKGQDILIRAIASLKQTVPSISVEFVGDGSARAEYEKLARDLGAEKHCEFTGFVSAGEVLKKMAAAAICVVPSRNEALGLVVIEAQSVGTPIVASRVDGIKETVIDGQTGFLVPPLAVEDFAEKIRLLLVDEELRGQMATNARTHFENNFSLKLISRHAAFFESLISK